MICINITSHRHTIAMRFQHISWYQFLGIRIELAPITGHKIKASKIGFGVIKNCCRMLVLLQICKDVKNLIEMSLAWTHEEARKNSNLMQNIDASEFNAPP